MMILLFMIILGIIPWNYASITITDDMFDAGMSVGATSQAQANLFAQNIFPKYSIAFMLQVENYYNQFLTEPQYIEHYGHVYNRPQSIAPDMAEIMTGHKAYFSATGCGGVVSWNIGNTDKMMVVMYDIPWNQMFYKNTLALGFFPKGNLTSDFYKKMYYGKEQGFERVEEDDGPHLRGKDLDPDFFVEGGMPGAPTIILNIRFYPKTAAGLANPKYKYKYDEYNEYDDLLKK